MNIFQVNRSQIQNRLEPKFYSEKYLNNEKRLYEASYPVKKLSEVAMLISDGTHFTPKYQSSGKKFLSVKDVRASKIDYSNSMFISDEEFEMLSKRCKPQKNDILLTKIGATFGLAAVIDTNEEFQIFVSLALIRPNMEIINPYYLEICLNSNFSYLQFDRNLKGAGVPDLHLEEIRKLIVVVPSMKKQIEIVSFYRAALQLSRNKQEMAKKLLESINTYLLSELEIILPEKDNSLSTRMFTVKFNEVCGERLDVFYNDSYYSLLHKSMYKSKYEKIHLSNLITDLKNGVEIRNYVEKGLRYLRVSDLSEDGIVNFNIRFVNAKTIPTRIKLNKNSFLISRSGSLGLVSAVTDEIQDSILSSHIFKVDLNVHKIIPEYLEAYLRCSLGQYQFFKNNNGGVIPEINQGAINKIIVILPSLSKQKEIADHIKSIRNQVKTLQNEAEQILADAKTKVEKMILGEKNA